MLGSWEKCSHGRHHQLFFRSINCISFLPILLPIVVGVEDLTDDIRVRQAFSAVKFWPPNFFLETNSDYVKNLGSGEKTHLLAPRGTQGGYLGQRPYIHQKIRKIAVFTTFWKEKNHSLATSSRTLIQDPMIPKKPDRALFRSIFGLKKGKKRAKCREVAWICLWMDFFFLFGFQLFQYIPLCDFCKKFEFWDWELYRAKNFRALHKFGICFSSIFLM